jgi:hypothetical protein
MLSLYTTKSYLSLPYRIHNLAAPVPDGPKYEPAALLQELNKWQVFLSSLVHNLLPDLVPFISSTEIRVQLAYTVAVVKRALDPICVGLSCCSHTEPEFFLGLILFPTAPDSYARRPDSILIQTGALLTDIDGSSPQPNFPTISHSKAKNVKIFQIATLTRKEKTSRASFTCMGLQGHHSKRGDQISWFWTSSTCQWRPHRTIEFDPVGEGINVILLFTAAGRVSSMDLMPGAFSSYYSDHPYENSVLLPQPTWKHKSLTGVNENVDQICATAGFENFDPVPDFVIFLGVIPRRMASRLSLSTGFDLGCLHAIWKTNGTPACLENGTWILDTLDSIQSLYRKSKTF